MQILESQLRQHVKLLLKEEVYGTIATVYHGSTQPPEEFLKIFETGDASSYVSTGWKPGKGAGSMYGHGLYTVWMKTDHRTFEGEYGSWIYKFKVNLHGFIIFDETICKKVYGKSITPLEQMKLIGKERELKSASKEELKLLSNPPVKNERSAGLAQETSNFLKGRVNGIVFFGSNDGPVVLIYDPDIVTPLAWTKLNRNKGVIDPWTVWNASDIKSSLKRTINAGTQANTERLQSAQKPSFNLKRIMSDANLLGKVYDKLSDDEKLRIIKGSKDKNVLKAFINDTNAKVRLSILKNSNSPEEVFEKLSKDKEYKVRAGVASSKNTPANILAQFVDDKNVGILAKIAENPNVSIEILAQLAKVKDFKVRSAIVHNENTPAEALILFANTKNEDKYVLAQTALHKNTPVEVLLQFAKSPDSYIRRSVAVNINAPLDILTQLSNDDYPFVRSAVATNKKIPAEMLSKLAGDTFRDVRWMVAQNPNVSAETLKQLYKDEDLEVRNTALYKLQQLGKIKNRKDLNSLLS